MSYYFVYFSQYDLQKEKEIREWILKEKIEFYNISPNVRMMYILIEELKLGKLKESLPYIEHIIKDKNSQFLIDY